MKRFGLPIRIRYAGQSHHASVARAGLAEFKVNSKFVLIPDEAVYSLILEIQLPFDTIVLPQLWQHDAILWIHCVGTLERSAVPFGAVPCRATLQRASHGSLKGSADLGTVVWALQHVVLCCNMLYCVATRCDAMQALQSETELTLLESDSNVAIISHSPIDDANGNRLAVRYGLSH